MYACTFFHMTWLLCCLLFSKKKRQSSILIRTLIGIDKGHLFKASYSKSLRRCVCPVGGQAGRQISITVTVNAQFSLQVVGKFLTPKLL